MIAWAYKYRGGRISMLLDEEWQDCAAKNRFPSGPGVKRIRVRITEIKPKKKRKS